MKALRPSKTAARHLLPPPLPMAQRSSTTQSRPSECWNASAKHVCSLKAALDEETMPDSPHISIEMEPLLSPTPSPTEPTEPTQVVNNNGQAVIGSLDHERPAPETSDHSGDDVTGTVASPR